MTLATGARRSYLRRESNRRRDTLDGFTPVAGDRDLTLAIIVDNLVPSPVVRMSTPIFLDRPQAWNLANHSLRSLAKVLHALLANGYPNILCSHAGC